MPLLKALTHIIISLCTPPVKAFDNGFYRFFEMGLREIGDNVL
jgi:hypothetical protein